MPASETESTRPPEGQDERPAVLIIGGLGHLGRFLALHIHRNNLASEIRIVDKLLPELAWLSGGFAEACAKENFVQADASRDQSLSRIFDRANGKEFDYVFNCAGESRFSQDDEIYKLRIHGLALNLGQEAARRNIKCFVWCSSGLVYKSDSSPRKETDRTKPQLKIMKWQLRADEDLAAIDGLNLVTLRIATIYGPYTTKYLSTLLCMARVYQHLGKEMKWLWTRDVRTTSVHVKDAARALWAAAVWYTTQREPSCALRLFNIVDHGNLTQGKMAEMIHQQFNISTGFHGSIISAFARLNLDLVVEDVNEELLDAWAELQQKAGITQSSPISPFMERELLRNVDHALDGSLFEQTTGFKYEYSGLSLKDIEDVIQSYKQMGWWP